MKHALFRITLILFTAALPVLSYANSGEALWMRNCKKCHGEDGKGSTPMGKRFSIPDYTNPDVQESLTDEDIRNSIVNGKKNEDGKKVMLAFGKRLSEEDLDLLVAYVRSLKEE